MKFVATCLTAVHRQSSGHENDHDGQRWLWMLSGFVLLALIGCGRSATTGINTEVAVAEIDSADLGVVTVSINRPDGGDAMATRGFVVHDVATGTKVEEFMRRLNREDPTLDIEITGDGQTAFLNKMDGVATGGGEGWTYRIDDEFVPKGIGVAELSPPTSLTWKFGGYAPE